MRKAPKRMRNVPQAPGPAPRFAPPPFGRKREDPKYHGGAETWSSESLLLSRPSSFRAFAFSLRDQRRLLRLADRDEQILRLGRLDFKRRRHARRELTGLARFDRVRSWRQEER